LRLLPQRGRHAFYQRPQDIQQTQEFSLEILGESASVLLEVKFIIRENADAMECGLGTAKRQSFAIFDTLV